jgi:hypothetical protein
MGSRQSTITGIYQSLTPENDVSETFTFVEPPPTSVRYCESTPIEAALMETGSQLLSLPREQSRRFLATHNAVTGTGLMPICPADVGTIASMTPWIVIVGLTSPCSRLCTVWRKRQDRTGIARIMPVDQDLASGLPFQPTNGQRTGVVKKDVRSEDEQVGSPQDAFKIFRHVCQWSAISMFITCPRPAKFVLTA